jgi:hypothetical protein
VHDRLKAGTFGLNPEPNRKPTVSPRFRLNGVGGPVNRVCRLSGDAWPAYLRSHHSQEKVRAGRHMVVKTRCPAPKQPTRINWRIEARVRLRIYLREQGAMDSIG